MRMRALLALLVLLGMLPIQGGTGASAGRADPGPTVLYMDATGGTLNLSLSEPSANGSIILGRNMTANFTVAGLSGLYDAGADWFVLDLSLVSFNFSGLELECRLDLDYHGNASDTRTIAFQDHTTSVALETERALIQPDPVDHGAYAADLRNGSLRLELARVDGSDGLLEVLCGNGGNASSLSIPYGAPLRADAGPDRSALVNQTVAFNTSLSASVDPGATEYLWNFGNGMTGAGDQVSVAYNRSGNYTVTLTLRWGGQEANDTALVAVTDNRPPTANAGLNITKRAGENITFRGAGSDPDGTIVSYNWSFGDGTSASGRNVTHSYGIPGDYAVVLTVRDDLGASGEDSLNVHINLPPVISGLNATKDGAGWSFQAVALDPDGTILRYNWSFGDGTASNATRPTHIYNAAGTYAVRCTVTDEYQDSATMGMNLTVTNAAPVISSIGVSGTLSVNGPVHFALVASDADGDALSYYWNFGDGTTSTARNPTHYYTKAGKFTVTITVSDGKVSVSRSEQVQISESSGAGDAASSILWLLPCIFLFIVVLIIIIARSAAEARKRQERGTQYGGGPQPQPYGGLPAGTTPYGTEGYQPYGTGGYQPYGTAGYQPYTGGQYQPPAPPRPARAPKAPPGVCPRCGSTDVQGFPDGHAKCQNCKKVFFTG